MTVGARVLIVEDEPQMRRFLRASLSAHDFDPIEAASGKEGIALATSHNPEVILLDLGLPDVDGIAWTHDLRQWSRTPIIVISARGRESDKVEALDAGADDYLTKPFGVQELLARVRVALRHARPPAAGQSSTATVGPLHVDLDRREVTMAGNQVRLTPIEYRLLVLLVHNAGKVLTHSYLLKEVWGPGHADQTHYLRVYMAQLRRKLEPEPARPRMLTTEPGVGYRLRDR